VSASQKWLSAMPGSLLGTTGLSPYQQWQSKALITYSTRGLDSAGALNFVKSLRVLADVSGTTSAVAIYQASQAIYNLFEKAVVLYEGRQIYFGPASKAKAFFEEQGWHCPQRQTTGDFLTSLTNPSERQAREGMENKVPRTAEDFERSWLNSAANKSLQQEIVEHEKAHPHDPQGHTAAQKLREEKVLQQANHVRPKSPYLISIWMRMCLSSSSCLKSY
jgi:ABC-type multidrug transport system ATPase subunit